MNPSVSVAVEVTPPVTSVLELGGRPRAARLPRGAGVRRSVWALGNGVADRHACGGGRWSASGTTGSVARSIVAISGGRSRCRWEAVRTTLASTCWVSAPWRVRLPPQTFRMTTAGRMACSARPVGRVDRRVPQEGEHGRDPPPPSPAARADCIEGQVRSATSSWSSPPAGREVQRLDEFEGGAAVDAQVSTDVWDPPFRALKGGFRDFGGDDDACFRAP